MFISKVQIKNYKLFDNNSVFEIGDFNIPNEINKGSGINIFVGENGCGKTSLLEALVLPILEFKADSFSIQNMNNPKEKVLINTYSEKEFTVAKTMPKGDFKAIGFTFKAGIRNRETKGYLSSLLVTDQLFISLTEGNPKEGSPDLRVSVNNPFAGKRFNETDILFLDKNRLFQTRTGTYSSTRFDKIMDDFDFQYNKKSSTISDLDSVLGDLVKKEKVGNSSFAQAINKFYDISGIKIHLDLIDNYQPFKNAYFSVKKENNQQIPLSDQGSGYEMIFSIIYSYYMSQQSSKKLIILIDEPELHLHPMLQQRFVEFLLEISKDVQIFLTTHSPLFIKQFSMNNDIKIRIMDRNNNPIIMAKRKLSYISSNETNYLAFNLATEEYHNELYEELFHKHATNGSIKQFDNDFFINIKNEVKNYPWMKHSNEVSIHTFIRNQIHHQSDNGKANYEDLKDSIKKMRTFL